MSAFIERITGSQVGGATERSIRLSLSIIRLGPAIILLLLVVAMTLLSPVFLTGANISNVVVQTSVLAVLAIGQLFVILVAGIDLSVGSVLGLIDRDGGHSVYGDLGRGRAASAPGHTPDRCGVRLDQRVSLREG